MLSPARDVAFQVLLRVEREASYAVALLNAPRARQLSTADRALAQEIVMGCLRWQLQLDWLAEHFSGRSAARLDAEVRVALRMGIYQMRFLERVPVSAAVDQSVEAVKQAGKRSAAGLVNAVLRKVTDGLLVELMPPELPKPERESIELSHPSWLLERWAKRFGNERATAIARINNTPPPLCVRVPAQSGRSPHLDADGAADADVCLAGVPCRFVRDCRVLTAPPPADSEFTIQDEASQIVPHLLETRDGQRVLDLCAAPGIKTGEIRELAPDAFVVACDIHPARLRLLRTLAPRTSRLEPPLCVALDGTRALPFRVRYDRILVDAPCSGTGTIRRNPEIKWRLSPKDLPILAARQRWLLSNALDSLTPGGRLVYSTCSLEPEENQHVVEEVLKARNDCWVRPVEQVTPDFLTSEGRRLLAGRFLETAPDQGLDGFFAAILEKQ